MPERKYTDETLNQAAAMRERGASYTQIAKRFGMSRGAVTWHCLRLGADAPHTETAPPPENMGKPVIVRGRFLVRRFTPEEDARLLAMEAQGARLCEMARDLGRKPNSVWGRLMTLARHEERAQRAAERAHRSAA